MLALLPDDGPTGCYFDQTEMVNVWWTNDWMPLFRILYNIISQILWEDRGILGSVYDIMIR
jgi:hypothetical protein